jgi:hypothetical protein
MAVGTSVADRRTERSWLTSTPPTSQRIPARSCGISPSCRARQGPTG